MFDISSSVIRAYIEWQRARGRDVGPHWAARSAQKTKSRVHIKTIGAGVLAARRPVDAQRVLRPDTAAAIGGLGNRPEAQLHLTKPDGTVDACARPPSPLRFCGTSKCSRGSGARAAR